MKPVKMLKFSGMLMRLCFFTTKLYVLCNCMFLYKTFYNYESLIETFIRVKYIQTMVGKSLSCELFLLTVNFNITF